MLVSDFAFDFTHGPLFLHHRHTLLLLPGPKAQGLKLKFSILQVRSDCSCFAFSCSLRDDCGLLCVDLDFFHETAGTWFGGF